MLRPRQSSVSSLLRSTSSPTFPGASTSSSTCSPLPCLAGPSTGSRHSSTSAPRRRPHADRLRHENAAGPSFDSLLSTSKGAIGRQGEVLRAKVQSRIRSIDAARPADLEYPAERPSPPAASLDAATTSSASATSPPTLLDSFSRKHTYLRLSLTERCSFRCVYCMPPDGVPLTPKPHLLTTPEVMRIAKAFVEMGVKKVRLTGGEPLLRKDVAEIVRKLRDDLDVREIGLTTNGLVLERMLPELVRSGLTHVNISIDSLRHDRFAELSRMPGKTLDKVMSAIRAALSIRKEQIDGGMDPGQALKIKLNVVVMKGRNEDEVADFVDLTRDMDLDVRFIEYMPFFSNSWSTSLLVPSSDLLTSLSARHSKIDRHVDSANDTTRHYTIPNHRGRFGFISSMTDHFCGSCNRVRVLADGGMKVCLFGDGGKGEVSLRDAIRQSPPSSTGEVGDGEVADLPLKQLISLALDKKHFKHAGLRNPLEIWQAAEGKKGGEETSVGREMSRIGG